MRFKADDWGDHNRVDRITWIAWVGCVHNTLSSQATAEYSNKNSKNSKDSKRSLEDGKREKAGASHPFFPFPCPSLPTRRRRESITVIFRMILIVTIAPKHPCNRDRSIHRPGRLC